MLGLEGGTVRVVPYCGDWPRLFAEERERLAAALGPWVLDIQHVGSTSVPGLAAKPILDIAVAVADFDEARRCVAPVEELGYTYRGENGIPRRHYFVRGVPRTHHVHMVEVDSADWRELLAFRDRLRSDPAAARAYAELKADLAARFPRDREAYQAGKEAFIRAALGQPEQVNP